MLLEVSKFLFIAVFVLIWFFAQVQKVVVQGDQEAEEHNLHSLGADRRPRSNGRREGPD